MNKKTILLILTLLAFFSKTSWAQSDVTIGEFKEEGESKVNQKIEPKEIAPEDPRLLFEGNVGRILESKILYGSNMIYDCDKQYFACVDLDSYEKCHERRADDKKMRKQNLGCAPLKKYQYLLDCSLEQSKYIENNRPVVFCLNY